MEKLTTVINTEFITLVNLLKFEGIIETGGQIKDLLENQEIKVNGFIVNEKRKKIYPGDLIHIEDICEIAVEAEEE